MTIMISAPAAVPYELLFKSIIPAVLNEAAMVLSLSVAITFTGLAITSLIGRTTDRLLQDYHDSTLTLLNNEGCDNSDSDDNVARDLAYSRGIK